MSDRLTPDEERRLQPSLLDVPAVSFVANLEAKGEYTGDRLRAQRPEMYQRVVGLLAAGHGTQSIQDATGVSKNTVKAVRKAEGDTIDQLKARLAEGNFEFAAQADEAADIILSEIMSSKARRSALTVKDVQALKAAANLAVTNGQLLTGKPTSNVSVEVWGKPSEDLNRQLAELYVSQLQSATHSSGEKPAARNGGALADCAPGDDRAAHALTDVQAIVQTLEPVAETDVQSPVKTT
jgi:hypothetical protein